jgi:hypothetical protein
MDSPHSMQISLFILSFMVLVGYVLYLRSQQSEAEKISDAEAGWLLGRGMVGVALYLWLVTLFVGDEALQHLPGKHVFALSGSTALLAIFFGAGYWKVLLFNWPNWQRARQLRRMPAPQAGMAQAGYATFAGLGEPTPGQEQYLPFPPKTPWLWYRLHVESLTEAYEEESQAPFILDSGIGRVLVFPQGMEIRLRDSEPSHHLEGRMRYAFHGLRPGPLTVIGECAGASAGQREARVRQRTSDILAAWKRNPDVLRTFDQDKDGKINAEEWEAARLAARQEAEKACPPDAADQLPTVRTAKNRWNLITDIPPEELAARYQLKANQHAITFIAAGLVTISLVVVALGR